MSANQLSSGAWPESIRAAPAASVSVVIPCYRCAATIERAVSSVAAQTLRPAEVILVDDHSPDDSLKVLESLQDRYPSGWVKLIPLPANGGPSVARNRGWDAAQEDYVAFLDADDSWHPQKIALQFGWMNGHPEATYSSHPWHLAEEGCCYEPPTILKAKRLRPLPMLLSNRSSTPTVMIRRSTPFRFDESKRASEDYLLWLEIILSGGKAYHLDAALTNLHKAAFGDGGLSGQLWTMQLGQWDTLRKLREKHLIGPAQRLIFSVWYGLKFLRRLAVVQFRGRASGSR